ncbi:L-tyrosine/L-tryptophan isonitrile synthase family protein [Vibrio quintilis]|uniref:Pyoverdine/dityrosine biosynthesis protein n=1 Tax=Vibrio quintilis TaxID=1117707 RepID=A0A1M7YXC6_9VIBR|nr:L-tyrosine/L-tryptophan isonitrile synthase family protein [Vibrio quintilis]SHO57339.1 Pyoverdine/dityrosine biosynthesis protein [Vibrio quintilis]
MLEINNKENLVEEISFILLNQLIAQYEANIHGLVKLKNQVRDFVANDKPVRLLLPAFPCKTNNLDKVICHLPDMGEYLVLRKFVQTIRDIQAIYEPGIIFHIFSDYHTFSDYISVDLKHHYDFSDKLRLMVERMNCSEYLKIVNFEHYPEFDDLEDFQYFKGLKDKYGKPGYEENFDKLKLKDNKMNTTYLGLKKFMSHDQKHVLAQLSYKQRRLRLSEIAKGMMVQGKALDNFLNDKFSDCIRLSIHQHPMVGKKYSLYLFDEQAFKTPWHTAVLFDAAQGKYVVDMKHNHLDRDGVIIPVEYDNRTWCYIRLTAKTPEAEQKLRQVSAVLYREKFGLMLVNKQEDCPVSLFEHKELKYLIKEFGTVVLRGFDRFEAPQALESWYAERGALVPWKFGNTHIISPVDGHQGKPSSSADSQEALPMHWDLLCPPPYMNVSQDLYQYEDFTPDEFVLYCHRNEPVNAETDGINVTSDTALAALTIHGREREQLRQTKIRYSTKESYFGGDSKVYPLLMTCPWTGQNTIRWWEVWDDRYHAGALQPNYSEIASSEHYTDMKALEDRLIEVCMNPNVSIKHQFESGDLVLLNNHTTVHGRTAFNGYREMWRIQLQPQSINSPWQPHNLVEYDKVS